ncbi:MAG: hypothetical protein II574_05230, partial [Ruminococcus sp.]|nr:hypothetical protein [Ruminococcus sp.]
MDNRYDRPPQRRRPARPSGERSSMQREAARAREASRAREAVRAREKKTDDIPEKPAVEAGEGVQVLNIIVCLGGIFLIAIVLLVMTVMGKREKESPSENRKLAEFPSFSFSSLFKGDFTKGISTYFTDTIPGRESFKSFNSSFTNCFGFSIGDVKINGTVKKVEQEKYDDKGVTTTKVSINTAPATTTTAASTSSEDGSDKTTTTTKSNKKEDEIVKIPENTNEGKLLGSVVVYGKGKETRGLVLSGVTFEMGKSFADACNKW